MKKSLYVNKIKINKQKILAKKKLQVNFLDQKKLNLSEMAFLALNYVILLAWSLIILFPVVSLIVAAFNTFNPRYVTVVPFEFGLDNFAYLFNNSRSLYVYWYGNTLLIAFSTMLISTAFVALNGYAYSRFKFAGSKYSLTFVMVVQIIPATASLISLYIIVTLGKTIGIDPKLMLIIIYSGGAIAGNTFILKGYLDTVSTDLDDSGKIDGCNYWQLFFRILLPIIRPMLAIIALWSFLTPFGDVILPKFVIFDLKETTLPVGLDSFINTEPRHVNAGAYAAGALLASVPTFILFMYLQRYVVSGLSAGSVKG